ncbi:MAG: hypothetical protein DI551_07570 [Micavibrio aeruginosavorus]|uniref:N-acetyltransferase domain-containing protein n=1 Tax=Micavibrio aeruginosavorus TaxID=349221 RepID=A0A2W5N3H1_9BACT|nr:MAG: hypothetical protein DI551_07570 [Micavibrio aeruginosavorus]
MFVKKLTGKDWKAYKTLRLEALSRHEDVFGASFEKEAEREDSVWQKMLSQGRQAFFGLYDGKDIVGITGIVADMHDESGRTAILIASYIREEYRGRKLSHLLYAARIDWAIKSGLFERIVVGHREGNEASRRANQAFGFELYAKEEQDWGDGARANIYRYEVRLAL